jgi:N-acetylmuramate 1-kinase
MLGNSQIMEPWNDFVDASFEEHGLRKVFENMTQPHTPEASKMTLIAGDASDRKFYRYQDNDFLAICMEFPKWEGGYGGDPMSWLGMHAALSKMGLPVPRVLSVDAANKCIWTEDFGQDFLNCHMPYGALDYNSTEAIETLELYEQALNLLVMAQYPSPEPTSHPALSRAFDFEKLHFEMKFFTKHFLTSLLSMDENNPLIKAASSEFISLCQWLSGRPRVLCHRDYHVRNVMVVAGKAKWIDFQDARMGPHTYDVVSLLRDSYVEIEESTRKRLALCYLKKVNERRKSCHLTAIETQDFWVEFCSMGLQRNLKALGSFGYLAIEKKKSDYLKYVAHTLNTILEQANAHPDVPIATHYPAIHALVHELAQGKLNSLLQNKIKSLSGPKS